MLIDRCLAFSDAEDRQEIVVASGPSFDTELPWSPIEHTIANGPFLALEVPPGSHSIQLHYEEPGGRLGRGISTSFLVGLLIALRFRRFRGPGISGTGVQTR